MFDITPVLLAAICVIAVTAMAIRGRVDGIDLIQTTLLVIIIVQLAKEG